MGITGACRREELTNILISDIEDHKTMFLIKIPKTKTGIQRSFTITGDFYNICKKYAELRPKDTNTSRFFLNFQNGHCTRQPIGINKFGGMPKDIAAFLNLPEPELYTGHSFRRTSATLLVDGGADITLKRHGGWKSNAVAEGYIEDSLNNKKKVCQQITNSIIIKPSTSAIMETPREKESEPDSSKNRQTKHSTSTPMDTQELERILSKDDSNESFGLSTSTVTTESEKKSQEPEPKRFKIDENTTFKFKNCSVTINVYKK